MYAISNHEGNSLREGHYTAMCKNILTNEWIKFDDTKTFEWDESRLQSKEAFILFYKLK